MDVLLNSDTWIAFAMLAGLEIILGVDNIIFISILVDRLPLQVRDKARRFGLGFGMLSRLLLLFTLSQMMGLTASLFSALGQQFSGRDLVLLCGGLFLIYKASHEIFAALETPNLPGASGPKIDALKPVGSRAFWGVIGQIAVIDIVFSLDSVITAVGMVDQIWVMVAAVAASVGLMLLVAKPVGDFVNRQPSVKLLALAFLVMVGMALTAEAFDAHVPKSYIYSSMAFSLVVEALNLRYRAKRKSATDAAGRTLF
jgi:predicted tellurium resistance membrane protein TerC